MSHPLRAKPFPVQGERYTPGATCSWADAERAHAGYAREYPSSARQQSVERIAERGGFGREEMDMWAPGWALSGTP